jgi:hypothetical protein
VRLFGAPLRLETITPAATLEFDLALQGGIANFKIEEHAIVRHGCQWFGWTDVGVVESGRKKLTAKQKPRDQPQRSGAPTWLSYRLPNVGCLDSFAPSPLMSVLEQSPGRLATPSEPDSTNLKDIRHFTC